MSQLSALRARATELGLEFDQRWGENKLKAAIAAVDANDYLLTEQSESEDQEPAAGEQTEAQQEQTDTGVEAAEQSESIDTPADPTQDETVAESQADADSDSITVKNISSNPMTIGFTFKAKPGFAVEIKNAQLSDKLRKQIERGVAAGMLELV